MWLLIFLIVPIIGMMHPGFIQFLNWGLLFPIALLAGGTMAWAVINVFTFFNATHPGIWFACLAFVGFPFAVWVTKSSLA